MRPDMSARRPLRVVIGYVLALATLAFVVRYVNITGSDFEVAISRVGMADFLFAVALFFLHFVVSALGFVSICRAMGLRVPRRQLVGAWGGSLLAKYVPGSVWQLVGRGMLLSAHGVSARQSLIGGLFEQGFSLLICVVIGVCAFVLNTAWWWCGALVLLGVLAIPLAIPVRLVRKEMRHRLYAALLEYSLAMLPFAGGYVLLLAPADLMEFIASLFLGVVAGLLAILVPGGLGVRESVVAFTMSNMNSGHLLAGLVLARIAILSAESLFTLIAHVTLLRRVEQK